MTLQKACITRGSPPTHPSICFHNLNLEFHCCWDFRTDKVLKKTPTNQQTCFGHTDLPSARFRVGRGGGFMLHQPPHTCRDSTSLWLEGWPWAGGHRGKRERGKAKSVVPLEATPLRQCLSGTEKDLFRKHESYFAHMDDNKAT